jgi:hypothetical protein
MFSRVVAYAKQASVVLGGITAVCVAYVAIGLPVPMTEASVNAKVNPIIGALNSLRSTQSIILSDLGSLQRSTLRNERFALERAAVGADPATKVTLNLRINQIQDELSRIDRRDDSVREDDFKQKR